MKISGKYTTQHGDITIHQIGDDISATYQHNGTCVGKLTGNKVEGSWRNKEDEGLFEWTFDGKGSFSGRYKSGLEHGAMRGKWDGKIITDESGDNKQVDDASSVCSEEQKKYLEEGINLEDFDEEYQGDDEGKVAWMKERAFVLEAVKQDGRILKHASEELKADREIVVEAIRNTESAIHEADEKLQCDPELLKAMIIVYFKGDDKISITDDDLNVFVNGKEFYYPADAVGSLIRKVEFILLDNRKEEFEQFYEKIIALVNAHHECFWIMQAIIKVLEKTRNNIDNYSYFFKDDRTEKYCEQVTALIDSFDTELDFDPIVEFETYFDDEEINSSWDDCKWTSSEDEEGLSFTEFIMEKTGMKWDTESWSDVKYYNHAISRLWLGLQNYTLKQNRQGFDEEQVAVLFYSVIDEKYEPIQDSGNGHYGSYVFETTTEYLLGISKSEYDLNHSEREDLEEFNGIQYDLKKVGQACDSDLFDDWPGASEYAIKNY